MANVFDKIFERAKQAQKRIVLTETEDERVLEAAGKAAEMDLCKVILLGNKEKLSQIIVKAPGQFFSIRSIALPGINLTKLIACSTEPTRIAKGLL